MGRNWKGPGSPRLEAPGHRRHGCEVSPHKLRLESWRETHLGDRGGDIVMVARIDFCRLSAGGQDLVSAAMKTDLRQRKLYAGK
jgi:hypothetical protein